MNLTEVPHKNNDPTLKNKNKQERLIQDFHNVSEEHCLKPKLNTHTDSAINYWGSDKQIKDMHHLKKHRPATSRLNSRSYLQPSPIPKADIYLDTTHNETTLTLPIQDRSKHLTQLLKKRGSGYLTSRSNSSGERCRGNESSECFGQIWEKIKKNRKNKAIECNEYGKTYCPNVVKICFNSSRDRKRQTKQKPKIRSKKSQFTTIDLGEIYSDYKKCPMAIQADKSLQKGSSVFSNAHIKNSTLGLLSRNIKIVH